MGRWSASNDDDRQVQIHLEEARRALGKAMAAADRYGKSISPVPPGTESFLGRRDRLQQRLAVLQMEDSTKKERASRAKQVLSQLHRATLALDQVGSLESPWKVGGDPDLIPEDQRRPRTRPKPVRVEPRPTPPSDDEGDA